MRYGLGELPTMDKKYGYSVPRHVVYDDSTYLPYKGVKASVRPHNWIKSLRHDQSRDTPPTMITHATRSN